VTRADLRRLRVTAIVAVLVASCTASAVAQQTPPPTPVDGRPSPFPTALRTPANATRQPTISAPVGMVADLDTGAVLYRKAAEAERPIASLTKLMTALIVTETTDPQDVVVVDPRAVYGRGDFGASSTLGLRAREPMTVVDLLYGLLLGSANDASEALAIHVDGSIDAFVTHMNRRAASLGMRHTRFHSPSGLDDRGRSTASDLLRLIEAVERRPLLRRIVATRFHRIEGVGRAPDRRIQNRNVLLWLYPGADGMKTGFTFGARACLIATATRDGRRLVAVVLGAPDGAFSDAAALLNHGFEGFTQEDLVRRGEPLGSMRIRGGTVPVIAGDDLSLLVPTASLDEIDRRLVADPKAVFPPAPGATVGTLEVDAPGLPLGSVPAVVGAVPPAPGEDGPWWVRTAVTIGRALTEAYGGLAD
jgi:D-alanyl-D-alanine carboxypeptidase (penicillin-binding protein 5/6)